MFKAKTDIDVKVVAPLTGKRSRAAGMAMPTCRSCSPRRRRRGSSLRPAGVRRFDVMCNDFIPVGRTTDPAELTGGHDVVAAFRWIVRNGRGTQPRRGDGRLRAGRSRHPARLQQQERPQDRLAGDSRLFNQ
jgi:ABC-type tungstate transport system permease subunit